MSESMLPLHKTTHFRRLREAIVALCKKCNIDSSKYNLGRITCYRATGRDLNGKNTITRGTDRNRSCFVEDNSYEIYECPSTTNKEKAIGEFLMIAHNTDFDYWIVTIFKYKIAIKGNKSYVNVSYSPKYCGYVMFNENNINIQKYTKVVYGIDHWLDLGINKGIAENRYFDETSVRENAYQFSVQAYTIKNTKNKNHLLNTDKVVRKYNKNNNRKR